MWHPPDPERFNPLVWEIVKQIPPGKVSTYGQIAAMMPPPEGVLPPDYDRLGARWVGQAMNATPPDQGIPWQRVINSRGMISLPEGTPSAQRQRHLLEAEGVGFDEKGRVDFDIVGWDGPDEGWLRERGLYPAPSLKKSSGGGQMRLF
jgi:methylated-DNA-protein-cysteine methyltransferase related protein